jgi:hypothetical protein
MVRVCFYSAVGVVEFMLIMLVILYDPRVSLIVQPSLYYEVASV